MDAGDIDGDGDEASGSKLWTLLPETELRLESNDQELQITVRRGTPWKRERNHTMIGLTFIGS
jgi:hypothetical protein